MLCISHSRRFLPAAIVPVLAAMTAVASGAVPTPDVAAFNAEVTLRLSVPVAEQLSYASLLSARLTPLGLDAPQYVLLLDRSPFVQAALLYWFSPAGDRSFRFIGASPVSTGKPGRVDYFTTPTGIFIHTPANPDFRAEGTFNENGIRGYGLKGMRVFDFGWQQAMRGWGRRHLSAMRLQLHATDPDFLQARLGTAQSKGCIRIHASLNTFLDRYGILDAEYEQVVAEGRTLWVLRPDRDPTPTPGRYLVIVDTGRTARPAWLPLPKAH
jgi:hypothetical protein